ncbi:MAG: cell division protein FtsZ [Bacteroidetes bacterium]|nr:cell division protein FtsZ [Bacteroidota bacterium]MBT3800993.1 cell division protein FtsZ [Bacteroidota bacterium]MBT4338494.1 cell division protein FtsZ [Bacteroidota bacterium]MBT4728377.1 cell division protein FtsZ [Bacteroidota bacterium]MBT5990110.1 cell division protein FtsZ [Bacteroidota bacterium]
MAKLNFDIPKQESSIIKVIGVGGGGGNAVNFMYNEGIQGVEFIVCNTDNQALEKSPVENKIQIGSGITGGRGVGGNPEVGEKAAIEDMDKIKNAIGSKTKMLFITAGMGGGTGTGAAPVIAKHASEMGILTVGIITYPFEFEGPKRKTIAESGMELMKTYVDALITIRNDRLLEMFNGLGIGKAFSHADDVLATAAKGIAEIITIPGEMNVDFEDVKNIMKKSGTAIMGNGVAEGEDRAEKAIQQALDSPLLKDKDIKGAKHILLNMTYGSEEVKIDELTKITSYIRTEVGSDVDMKFGHCFNANMGEELSITIIATSLEGEQVVEEVIQEVEEAEEENQEQEKIIHDLNEECDDDDEQMSLFSQNEPFIKNSQEEERLKELSYNIRTPGVLEKYEKTPAYIRRNVKLKSTPHSSESEISRFILEEEEKDKKPEIREDNSFLNDNVD